MKQHMRVYATLLTLSSSLVVMYFIWRLVQSGHEYALDFTWRWFAIFPLLGIITVGVLLVIMLRRIATREGSYIWYGCLSLCNIALLLLIMLAVLSATPEAEAFWQGLRPMAYIPIPALFLYMSLSMVKETGLPRNMLLFGSTFFAMIFLMYISGASSLIEHHEPYRTSLEYWGYQSQQGELRILFFGYSLFVLAVTVSILLSALGSTINQARRKQYMLMIGGGIAYAGLAVVFDVLLRSLYPHLFPPMAFAYVTVLNVIIGYAIIRYGTFRISQTSLSPAILNNLTEMVIGVNDEDKIEFVNKGAERMLGYRREVLLDQNIDKLFSPATIAEIKRHAYGTGVIEQFDEAYSVDSVGREIPVALTVNRIIDERRKDAGHIYIAQNISELHKKTIELAHEKSNVEQKVIERTRQLHDEQAKLRASIDSLSIGFMLIDEDLKPVILNDTLAAVFGIPRERATLDAFDNKFANFDLIGVCREVIRTTRAVDNKEVIAGSKIYHVAVSPVTTSVDDTHQTIGAVVLIDDISEAKVMERSRDEFFSIASHELRTPLTSIRGNAKMIMDFYAEALKDEGLKEMVGDIHDSSVRLIEIVNDFLDVSRLEQRKIAFEMTECSIEKILESVAYEMKVVLQEKKLYLKVDHTLDTLPKIYADNNRVKQIIYNLIGNAVKFTESGGITVKGVVDQDMLKVTVADTGRGIPVQARKLLFHKFQQAGDSLLTRDTTRGTGLGLYISRLLAINMGGDVELVESKVGKGSTFAFTVPIATPERVKRTGSTIKGRIDITTGMTLNSEQDDTSGKTSAKQV